MLEDILVELIRAHTPSEPIREALLEAYEGVSRRRMLYKNLSGHALGDVLTEDWGQSFLADWAALASRRNKVAHGQYYFRASNDVELLKRVLRSFARAFVAMHNDAVAQRQPLRDAAV